MSTIEHETSPTCKESSIAFQHPLRDVTSATTLKAIISTLATMCGRDSSDLELAKQSGLRTGDVAMIRKLATTADLPVSEESRVSLELAKRVTSRDGFGLFARISITTHCGRDYTDVDKFCTQCGEQLHFLSAVEELLKYLKKQAENNSKARNTGVHEQWIEIVGQLDRVAKHFDPLRHQQPDTSYAVGENAIKMGRISVRLRNILIREGLLYFTDIEDTGVTRLSRLRNFGEACLTELANVMEANERDMGWLDR